MEVEAFLQVMIRAAEAAVVWKELKELNFLFSPPNPIHLLFNQIFLDGNDIGTNWNLFHTLCLSLFKVS